MAFKLAEIFVELKVRSGGFIVSLKKIRELTIDIEDRLQGISRAARKVFAVSAAGLTGSALAFASLDKSLARVRAITNATSEEMVVLRESAKEMGRITIFSAGQAAEAMSQLALQGFSTQQIFGALPQTLNVAAISMIDVATAAKLTAGVMRSSGKSISELGTVVDVLAAAATRSSTTVANMAIAFRQVGPTASQAGVSVEELGAILQVMANRMIRGELAGTALRNLFTRLAAPPAEARKALEELGITVADSAGNFRNMIDILSEFIDKVREVGGIQRVTFIRQVAGFRAIAPLSALVEAGSDRLRQIAKDMQNVGGIAAQIASNQLDNLQDRFTRLRQAITLMGIAIGEQLEPAMLRTIAFLRDAALAFDKMTVASKSVIAQTLLWTAGISALVIVLPLLVASVKAMVVVWGAWVALLVGAGLLSPLGALLALVVALTPAFLKAVTGAEKLTDALKLLGVAFTTPGTFDANIQNQIFNAEAAVRERLTRAGFDPELTDKGREIARGLSSGAITRKILFDEALAERRGELFVDAAKNLAVRVFDIGSGLVRRRREEIGGEAAEIQRRAVRMTIQGLGDTIAKSFNQFFTPFTTAGLQFSSFVDKLEVAADRRRTLGAAIREEIEKRASATFKTTGLAQLAQRIQESITGPTGATTQRAAILKAAEKTVQLDEERNKLIEQLVNEGIGLGVR